MSSKQLIMVECPDGFACRLDDCLSKCRLSGRCVPISYLKQAVERREWHGKPSVTQLLKGTREAVLELTVPTITINPGKAAFRIIGTRGHTRLEGFTAPESFSPERLEWEGITGQFDELEFEGDRLRLIDTKISGSYKVAQAIGLRADKKIVEDVGEDGGPILLKSGPRKGQPKTHIETTIVQGDPDLGDWQLQLNAYRIMVEKSLDQKVAELFMFLVPRDGGTFVARDRGVTQPIYMVPVPIMDDTEVAAVFLPKRDALLAAMVPGAAVPPPCSDSECWEGKKCNGHCVVASYCRAFGDNKWLDNAETIDEQSGNV